MTRLDYAGMPVEQALVPAHIVVERDFARGNADQYHVIFDANTVFMDETLIDRIEAWVRRGGTFVTSAQGQTGRHTPEEADVWPISRLTGYRVKMQNEKESEEGTGADQDDRGLSPFRAADRSAAAVR